VAATLGVLSVALLGASFVWAHHWGAQADTLVAAWAVATIGSLVASIWLLRDEMVWPTRLALRLAKIGLAGGSSRSRRSRWPASFTPRGSTPPAPAAAADRRGDPGRTAGVGKRARGYD